ncbi:hypothetical protein ACQUFY_07395 [Robbsia andropogonis]
MRPRFQTHGKLTTMFGCTNQMLFQSKMLSNRTEAREETLGTLPISE